MVRDNVCSLALITYQAHVPSSCFLGLCLMNVFNRAVFYAWLGSLGFASVACSVGTPPPASVTSSPPLAVAEVEQSLGTLNLMANGESLVQEGVVSKDGWAIAFDHVYLTVVDVVASQQLKSDIAADPDITAAPDIASEIASKTVNPGAEAVSLSASPITVDLVTPLGEPTAVKVAGQTVPTGYYKSLYWSIPSAAMVETSTNARSGVQFLGRATKAGQTIDFDLQLDPSYRYVCGPFVGDTRKGFVNEGENGEVEMTLHIDHVFGDSTLPADDPVNQDALGFDSLAAIAQDNSNPLTADQAALKAALSASDYDTLVKALLGLGHVGEGHCTATELKE